jgi:hypothetical protein
VPAGREDVVIPRLGGLTVSDNAAVAEADALSVTFTVKFADPVALGVPDSRPLADRVRPAGSVPLDTDHVYRGDPPEAARPTE